MFLLRKETPFLGQDLKLVFLKWNNFFLFFFFFFLMSFSILICFYVRCSALTGNEIIFLSFYHGGNNLSFGSNVDFFWRERGGLNKNNRAKTIFKSKEYNKDIHKYSKHVSRDIINDKAVLQLWREWLDCHDLSSLKFQIKKVIFFLHR